MKTFKINGVQIEANNQIEAVKKYKDSTNIEDSKMNDKSMLQELETLAQEANSLEIGYGWTPEYHSANSKFSTLGEVKNFLNHCLSAYNYISKAIASFANEVNKAKTSSEEHSEKVRNRVNTMNIGSPKSFYGALSTVRSALQDIQYLDIPQSKEAAILYKKYKQLAYDFDEMLTITDSTNVDDSTIVEDTSFVNHIYMNSRTHKMYKVISDDGATICLQELINGRETQLGRKVRYNKSEFEAKIRNGFDVVKDSTIVEDGVIGNTISRDCQTYASTLKPIVTDILKQMEKVDDLDNDEYQKVWNNLDDAQNYIDKAISALNNAIRLSNKMKDSTDIKDTKYTFTAKVEYYAGKYHSHSEGTGDETVTVEANNIVEAGKKAIAKLTDKNTSVSYLMRVSIDNGKTISLNQVQNPEALSKFEVK